MYDVYHDTRSFTDIHLNAGLSGLQSVLLVVFFSLSILTIVDLRGLVLKAFLIGLALSIGLISLFLYLSVQLIDQ